LPVRWSVIARSPNKMTSHRLDPKPAALGAPLHDGSHATTTCAARDEAEMLLLRSRRWTHVYSREWVHIEIRAPATE
jgi:hypothetical protein